MDKEKLKQALRMADVISSLTDSKEMSDEELIDLLNKIAELSDMTLDEEKKEVCKALILRGKKTINAGQTLSK